MGQRSFLALDWQPEDWQHVDPRPCVVQREFPPRSLGEPILRRLLSLPPHPQLPQVQGYFEQGGLGYLVQGYCPGQALTQWTARDALLGGTLPGAIVARLIETLLSLLSEIHQQGLIHGDVQPANILVPSGSPETWLVKAGRFQDLYLVDWGNAQEPATPLPPWLTTNQNICSIHAEYAAPEQLAGQPHFASDFYSVGVVGVQLLTGMHPFHWLDRGDHWHFLYFTHREDRSPHLSPDLDLAPDREDQLCAQLDRLLHPDPHQRHLDPTHPHRSRSSPVPTTSVQSSAPIPPTFPPWHLQATLSGASGHTAAVKALVSPPAKALRSCELSGLKLPPWFVSAGDDRTLRLWNLETGARLTMVTVAHKPIQVLCGDPHSCHRWVSGSGDGLLRWWEIGVNPDHTLALIPLVNGDRHHQGSLNALVFITPHLLASAGADKIINLWSTDPLASLADPQPMASLTGHRLAIQALAVDPQAQYLASGSSDATVKVWDPHDHRLIATLKGHTAAVKTVAFSPDGQYLASAGNDRTIQIWETQTWTLKFTLPGHGWPITQLTFSHPQTLWSSSWDFSLKCWDLSTLLRGAPQEFVQPVVYLQEHTDVVTGFLVLDDGVLISGGADCAIKIFRLGSP